MSLRRPMDESLSRTERRPPLSLLKNPMSFVPPFTEALGETKRQVQTLRDAESLPVRYPLSYAKLHAPNDTQRVSMRSISYRFPFRSSVSFPMFLWTILVDCHLLFHRCLKVKSKAPRKVKATNHGVGQFLLDGIAHGISLRTMRFDHLGDFRNDQHSLFWKVVPSGMKSLPFSPQFAILHPIVQTFRILKTGWNQRLLW